MYGFSNHRCRFPNTSGALLGWLQYRPCSIGTASAGPAWFQEKHEWRMKVSFRSLLFLTIYIIVCTGVLVLSSRQSIPQPTGLLVVAMVVTPLIVSICGGLPIDCLRKADWFNGTIVLAGGVDLLCWFNQGRICSHSRQRFSMSAPKVVGYQNGLQAWPKIFFSGYTALEGSL